jgi:phosphoheptose isomerase
MSADPRFKNKIFAGSQPGEYLSGYLHELTAALQSLEQGKELTAAYSLMEKALKDGATVFVAGNGGSAAIAEHLSCDWSKGTCVGGRASMHLHSLASNTALLTAIANDYGYEKVFSTQLEMFAKSGDLLLLISSSGNSPNILQAARSAKKMGLKIIGFSGFSGGELKQLSDISLYVSSHNYGIVEDSHQILMHILAQYLAKIRDSSAL